MHDMRVSKADLHVHSKYSDRPSEWFLRRIGAPECFVEPREVYRRARQRGMEFVTISDHNCIRGALEIADLPGTFISAEVTTYFPENGCKIHLLVLGIDEEQFRMIQELRADIYQLQHYLMEESILCSVSHPLFRVNGRLTIDQVEKLILMFPRFEEINGARDRRSADLAGAVLRHLTPELLAKMADRHGLEPCGPEPWKKTFTGGSDDHSGAYIGAAYTATPLAEDVGEFLAHLRRGDHEPGGSCGGSVAMGHSLYHIAYSYYKDRILRGGAGGKPTLVGELFKKLLEGSGEQQPAGIGHSLRGMATRLVWSRQMNKLSEMERLIVDDFSRLFSGREDAGHGPAADGRPPHVPHRLPDQPHAGLRFPLPFRRLRPARKADGKPADGRLAGAGGLERGALPGRVLDAAQGRGFPAGGGRPFLLGGPSPPGQPAQGLDHRHLCGSQRGEPHHSGPGRHCREDRPPADGAHLPGERAAGQGRSEEFPARRLVPHAGI